MTIPGSVACVLLGLIFHWVGDFVLQTERMAKFKSKDVKVLTHHVCVYGFILLGMDVFFLHAWGLWALANAAVHWVVDYFTSRRTAKLWEAGRVHDFFVVVGLDQSIHLACVLVSAIYMLNWLRG